MISLERGALFAEIISAVAVVISIVYLGHQVGENTNAVKVQTSHALLDLQVQYAAWNQDLDHADLMLRGLSEPSLLSAAEWRVFVSDRTTAFNLWEQAQYSFLHGDLDEDQWESWDRSFASSLCSPGNLLFWDKGQHGWGDSFQALVNKHESAC